MSRLIKYWLGGGAWRIDGRYCRSAMRNYGYTPDTRFYCSGFRVVRGGKK